MLISQKILWLILIALSTFCANKTSEDVEQWIYHSIGFLFGFMFFFAKTGLSEAFVKIFL